MAEKLSTPAPPLPPPRIVGVVHSPGSLRAALALGELGGPDLLELRADAFAAAPEALDELLRAAPRPFLLTVRDPREGGADPALTPARRRALFERFLPAAALVDLELRSLAQHPTLAAVAAAGSVLNYGSLDAAIVPGQWPAARLRERLEEMTNDQ